MTHNANHWYIESRGPNTDAVRRAVEWLRSGRTSRGWRSALLAVPGKGSLEGAVESVLGPAAVKELSSAKRTRIGGIEVHLMTELITAASPGPVLAVYPTVRLLEKIDALRGPSDVLVVPWTMDEVMPWIRTWSARELDSSEEPPEPTFSNPTVRAALEALTRHVNLGTGLAHPSDRASAVEMFRILHRGGESFSAEEVRAWLVSQLGWQPHHASDVAEMAAKVLEGRQIRLATSGGWARDALERWRENGRRKDTLPAE